MIPIDQSLEKGTILVLCIHIVSWLKSNDQDTKYFFLHLQSIKLYKANNVVVEGLTSVNPASQHVLVVESQKVTIRNVKFNEKPVVSNTKSNGIYISASSQVSVSNSFISTGDDCVTIAPGSTSISITGLTCAGGKGIRYFNLLTIYLFSQSLHVNRID